MKKWILSLWYKKVIYPGMMRHQAQSTVDLRNAIVFQMHYGGVSMSHINKWLRYTHQDTIKAYMVMPDKTLRVFYEAPSGERIKELGGKYVPVSQYQ